MLTILLNLVYNYQEKELNESIIIPSHCSLSLILKSFFWLRKSLYTIRLGNNFLIDGKKVNSKKDLFQVIDKINHDFIKKDEKTSPFCLIIIINLDYISTENQIIFKNFLEKKGMLIKFFFFINDLHFLDKSLLARCTILSPLTSVFKEKKCKKFKKLPLKKIYNLRNFKKVQIFRLKKKKVKTFFYLEKKLDKKIITIKNIFFKICKKLSNEVLYLFVHKKFFKKLESSTVLISHPLSNQLQYSLREHFFYLEISRY